MGDDPSDIGRTRAAVETVGNEHSPPRTLCGGPRNPLPLIQGHGATTVIVLLLAAAAAGLLAADPAAATDDRDEWVSTYVTNTTAGAHTNVTVVGNIDEDLMMGADHIAVSLCRANVSSDYAENRDCWRGPGGGWIDWGGRLPYEWIQWDPYPSNSHPADCTGTSTSSWKINFACSFNATLPGNATPDGSVYVLETAVDVTHDIDLQTHVVNTQYLRLEAPASTQNAGVTPVSGGVAAEAVAVGAFVMGALTYAAGRRA